MTYNQILSIHFGAWLIQHLNENAIVVETTDLAPSSKDRHNVIRLLHVDDDPSILEISKQILMDVGNFEIDSVCCVDEAFEKLANKIYDVVVSDYEMPIKNGLEFLQLLREQKNEIPFILFTGKGREDVAVKALNLGVDRYLNKNGSPETVYCELADAINKTVERRKSRKLLAVSESKYRMLVEKSLQGILVVLADPLRLVFANDIMGKILGYSSQELMSLPLEGIRGLVYREDRAVFFKRLENRFRGEQTESSLEFRAVRKDGSTIWLNALSSRVEYEGQPAVQGMFLDINERKKAEGALRQSEERYRSLFENSADGVMVTKPDGSIISANPAACNMLGMTEEELRKAGRKGIVIENQKLTAALQERERTGRMRADLRFRRKNGSTFIGEVSSGVFTDSEGNKNNLIIRDATERQKTEESLRQGQDMLEAITENLGAGLGIISKDYRVLWVNRFIKNNVGNVEGRQCYSSLNTLDHICPDCGVRKVFEEGVERDSHEYTQIGINGKPYYVELIATPLKDKDGNVNAALEFVVDIAERKRMQQELQANEAKFRAISDSTVDAIFMYDDEDKIAYWNPAAERIFGYTEKEIIGEKVNATLVPPRSRKDHLCLTAKLAKAENKSTSGEIWEFPALRKDGSEFSMELSITALRLSGNQYFVAIARDTTERKKTEVALHESQQKFKALFSANPDAAVFLDTDFRVIEVNPRFTGLFGYSLDELKDKIITEIIVPDDSKEESRILRQKLMLGSVEIVTARRRKDGSNIPLMMSGGPVIVNEKVIGSVMLYKDISDIITVHDELSKALDKAELLNEKLRVVGSLCRHDVRNKLSAVAGFAYLLKKKYGEQKDIVDGLSRMEQAVSDSAEIFDFAKMYEQLGIEELTYISVETTIKEAYSLFSGPLPKINNECHGLTVLADSLLRELFYNFIDNTRKYGKKTTTIKVHYEMVDQDDLKLVYEDDGVGVSFENKPSLFKEGFSAGGSTGFGLFLTKKMMEVYGWEIEETGEPGKGAKFTITIPKLNKNGQENYRIAQ